MAYYIEQPPTPERAAEVYAAALAEAKRVAQIVGMSAWYEHAEKATTPEEYAMLVRSWKDGRNPGTVTMVGLFIQFCKHREKR